MKKLAFFVGLILALADAQAATRYVTDQFKINLRSGESSSHRILRGLESGAPVEVLSVNEETGYSKVRAGGDLEGYVLSYQLMDEPSARQRLAAAEARLRELQQEPDKLASKLSVLQQNYTKLEAENAKLAKLRTQLQQELDGIRRTAANAVQIANERSELRKNVINLTRQVEDLKQENRDLGNQTAQNWFLIGAGVVLLGVILGLILPHLRFQRRKNSWGSL